MQVCQVSASSSIQFLRRRILKIFFENLPFMSPNQPIKSWDLDKSGMKHGELPHKHFCKKKQKNYKLPKQPEFLSNQDKKHNFCRGQCPKHVCQVSTSSSIWFLRRFLNIFIKIDPFCRPDNQSNTPIWTKVILNIEDFSINISVKKIPNISIEAEKKCKFPLFPL